MKRLLQLAFFFLPMMALLTGCGLNGEKDGNLSIIYMITAFLSFLLLAGYCFFVQEKDIWFILLFTSVVVVNLGYLSLSLSSTLDEALLANRISYFGSVFLPAAMLLIIHKVANIPTKKVFTLIVFAISIAVFFIAATPGYLDIYYKEVELITVNGMSTLDKTYGPLHPIYLIYLMTCFSAMIVSIIYSTVKKRISSNIHSIILAGAVLVNIGVWFIEQLVKIEFEFLSVSYIISGMFLLGLTLMNQDNSKQISEADEKTVTTALPTETTEEAFSPAYSDEFLEDFKKGVEALTQTEKCIYNFYLEKKSTKDILSEQNITENTLKFHNKNIYGKLGVSSRKQLVEVAEILNKRK